MKFFHKFLISLFLFSLILFPIISYALTPNEEKGIMLINENMAVPEDINIEDDKDTSDLEIHQGDMYSLEPKVKIEDDIDGNLYVIANSITINSEIKGDAFIIADTIEIGDLGFIDNSLFALAKTITVKGSVYDVYACCNQFNLSDGIVNRYLHIASENVDISGIVRKNAYIACKNLTFGISDENSDISIDGNLEYSSSNEISIPNDVVSGDIEFNKITIDTSKSYVFSLANFLTMLLVIWLILLWLSPKFLQNSKDLLKNKKSHIILYGFLGLIVPPIISIVLLLTSFASSAGLLTLAIYILSLCIAKPIFTIAINNLLCEKWKLEKFIAKLGLLLLSGVIIWGISFIPYIGTILTFAMLIIGLGTIFTYIIPEKKKE